ncbi:heterokaryon incompatibility protein-domain-containing protein [Dendryphion nanum]|uniref:Heterokaryon incompatibility protein-domain-containing protein n=1 Tax=Dendryphion nanum TaxID=256645 RepID=A0A9P9IVZ9_9PLEO|nr:heterokaryon incompatibility protein-domain-containing protein [Dendryphion nanum]
MLCSVCKNTLEGMLDPTITRRLGFRDTARQGTTEAEQYTYGHHFTHQSFIGSLGLGCHICYSFFKDNVEIIMYTGLDNVGPNFFSTLQVDIRDNVPTVVITCGGMISSTELEYMNGNDNLENLVYDLGHNTGSQGTWSQIRANYINSTYFPSRLLKIDQNNQPATYKLVKREDCAPGLRYTALSYVWGTESKESTLRLLQSNFEKFREGGCIDDLPKTFRDAIHVTTKFDTQYIWIDSLCIIQDSLKDWQAESATMQDVYSNSMLTISATAGSNAHAGLFYERDVTSFAPTMLEIKLSSGHNPILFRHSKEMSPTFVTNTWLNNNKVISRGWCLQERLLSPRVLHFGAQQVFWECWQQHASEINPQYITVLSQGSRPDQSPGTSHPLLWKSLIGELRNPQGICRNSFEEVLNKWYSMMIIYTTWDLHRGLCWTIPPIFENREPTDLKPSWSWISVLDSISYANIIDSPEIYWFVAESDCKLCVQSEGSTNTKEVRVLFEQKFGCANVIIVFKTYSDYLELTGPWAAFVTDTVSNDRGFNIHLVRHFEHPDTGTKVIPYPMYESPYLSFAAELESMERVFCIFMKSTLMKNGSHVLFALVFAEDRETATFRRIGIVTTEWQSLGDSIEFVNSFERKTITVI